MSQYKYAEIADTVYFWFAANTTAGAAGDGATPLYDVRLAGAAASAIPTASGTPTLLTHANYTDGLHEIAIDTTGYAAGEYAVFCTLTISTVNPAGFCGSFLLRTAGTGALAVDLVSILGTVLTETAGLLAGGFKKFFNIATPTGTLDSLPDAVPGAAGGLPTTDGTSHNQLLKQGTHTSVVIPTVSAVTGHTPQSADNNAILAHATYGNAKLARTGADSDTLETLSDQIDGVSTVDGLTIGQFLALKD